MKYPCELIKDLLPLYVDKVASEESNRIVEEHLTECDSCHKLYNALQKQDDTLSPNDSCATEEEKAMTDSLKKVKLQINQRQRRLIAATLALILLIFGAWQVLFNLPLKTVSLDDVRITVGSYKLQDLPYELMSGKDADDNDKVTISLTEYDEEDTTPTYRLEIPALPDSQLQVTDDMMNTGGYVSSVSLESRCRLANINWGIDGDVMYIHTLKTTLLGGRKAEFGYRNDSIDFRPVNKVVYLNDGSETVLWENN